MKKLLVSALLVVGMATFAQEKLEPQKQRLAPEQRVELQVKKLTKDLNLSEKQAQEVRVLAMKEIESREAKKAEMEARKEGGGRLTPEEMKERKAKFQEEKAAFESNMKKILSSDQYTKWLEKREARKEKMEERIENRREERIEDGKDMPKPSNR
jgi:protein CpxP